MLREEDIPGPVAAMKNVIVDPKTITIASAAYIGIENTTGVYDESNSTTPILKINPAQ